jgi:hypothetical protein
MVWCFAHAMVATVPTSALIRTEATRTLRNASAMQAANVSVTDDTKNRFAAPPSYFQK